MNNYFFFDGDKDKNNYKSLAFVTYINGHKIKKRIGEKLPPDHFNQNDQVVKRSFSDHKRINQKLKKISRLYEELISQKGIHNISNKEITDIIRSVRSNITFQEIQDKENFLTTWIEYYQNNKANSESSVESYLYVRKSIEKFELYKGINITFDYLSKNNEDFREEYMRFLKTKINNDKIKKLKNTAGGVRNKFEKINTVINYYNRKYGVNIPRLKINVNDDNIAASKMVIHLDKNELSILYGLLLEDKLDLLEIEKRHVANFLFRSFTSLRFSEMKQLTKENFAGKYLKFISFKTKKTVDLPLFDHAKDLAAYVNYKWDKWVTKNEKAVLIRQETYTIRKVISMYINERFIDYYDYDENEKTTYKLGEKISSHSARKSSGTLIYNHTKNIYTASIWMNHQKLTDTVKYLGLTTNDLKSDLNDLIINGQSVFSTPTIRITDQDKIIDNQAIIFGSQTEVDFDLPFSNLGLRILPSTYIMNDIAKNEITLDDRYKIISQSGVYIIFEFLIFVDGGHLFDKYKNESIIELKSGTYFLKVKNFREYNWSFQKKALGKINFLHKRK